MRVLIIYPSSCVRPQQKLFFSLFHELPILERSIAVLRACYLAQKLCFWTGIIFIDVIVSVCVSVCVWIFTSIISKSLWPILIKLGKMIYNDKRQVPLEYELNRLIRTEVTENPHLYFFLLLPFDNILLMLPPLILLDR